jgi:hypothetical protein
MSSSGETIPLSSGGQSPQRPSDKKISFSIPNSAEGDVASAKPEPSLGPSLGNSAAGIAAEASRYPDPDMSPRSIIPEAMDAAATTSGEMSRQSLAFRQSQVRGSRNTLSADRLSSKDDVIDAMRRRFRYYY